MSVRLVPKVGVALHGGLSQLVTGAGKPRTAVVEEPWYDDSPPLVRLPGAAKYLERDLLPSLDLVFLGSYLDNEIGLNAYLRGHERRWGDLGLTEKIRHVGMIPLREIEEAREIARKTSPEGMTRVFFKKGLTIDGWGKFPGGSGVALFSDFKGIRSLREFYDETGALSKAGNVYYFLIADGPSGIPCFPIAIIKQLGI